MSSETIDIEKALRLAFSLGQTYWQQADSESYSQNRKSEATHAKFNALVAEVAAALAQPAPTAAPAEPVAWRVYFPDDQRQEYCDHLDELIDDLTNCRHDEPEPLYATPPARLHAPLSDERINELWDGHTRPVFGKTGFNVVVFARAIEAAHGITAAPAAPKEQA